MGSNRRFNDRTPPADGQAIVWHEGENRLAIPDRPISFEVFADDFAEMERQAGEIAGWGENVYVKIPVMNTARQNSYDLIRRLVAAEPAGRPVVVVSSDGEVVRDTGRDGAWTAPSSVLLTRLG